ncbi:MAG: DUF4296 domain-containing protein [Bacteroidales bacterium]|nr:DUF4296 domain-containing protein [Bacteroidales bacterium]
MRLLPFILALLLFSTACQKAEKTKAKPVVLLTETQMVELITDVQLLEAALNHRRNLGQNINELKLLWFNQLFEKHHLTDVIFEENISYYNEQPAVMEQILEEVLANIIQEQAQLKKVEPEKESE